MRIAFSVFFCLLLVTVGNTQENCNDCGVAYMRSRMYDSKQKAVIPPLKYNKDNRFLFFDSMIIAERHALYPDPDYEKVHVDVMGYMFIDLRTKSFYNYRHFSDTAGIILAWRQPAKGRAHGGANFFDAPLKDDSSKDLPDTVISGKSYHRRKGFFLKNDKVVPHPVIVYYLDEQDRPVAYFIKAIINGKMASATRFEWPVGVDTTHYIGLDVESNNLTNKELKVFAAWKKNAAKYPIPKNSEKLYILGRNGKFIEDKRPKYAVRG